MSDARLESFVVELRALCQKHGVKLMAKGFNGSGEGEGAEAGAQLRIDDDFILATSEWSDTAVFPEDT